MIKFQDFIGYVLKIFFILVSFLLIVSFASENERVDSELSSVMTVIPLKQALGKDAYDKAINSGKYRFVGNSKCRLCHRKFFIGRKKDPHDHSMKSLEGTKYQDNPKCLICHATGFNIPTGFISIETTPRLTNVQCEGCHGPGNIHIRMAKDKKQNAIKKFKEGGFLAGLDNPKILKNMCIACHTKRWNRAYHDLDKAFAKYKRADPNSKKKDRMLR